VSALGSFFARAMAALGGPQVATVIVVGGIAVGAIGGGAMASGVLGGGKSGAAGGQLAVYPCPNQGPALARVDSGQQLLVTGRLADGSWLRIHLPTPGRTEGWVQSTPLTVNGSIDTLPVVTCAPVTAVASPDVVPQESLTAIVNATPTPEPPPSASAVPPSSGPTPTPSAHPSVAGLVASTRTVSYDQGSYCPTAVKTVTFSVRASGASGIASVTLFWRAPGASAFAQAAMSRTGGTATSGTWQASLDTTANGLTKAGALAFYAIAKDATGVTSRIPPSGAGSVTVAVCANTGPSIAATAAAGSRMYSDPFGLGCTPTTSDITATVQDPQGVKSVTLFFRRGSGSWSSKPMNNTTVPPRWYANLDTLGDKIPVGTLSWYIRAVDGKNAVSQSRTVSVTILLCKDKTAPVVGPIYPKPDTIRSSGDNACTASRSATIQVLATDPESGVKSVTLWYRFGAGGTARGLRMTAVPGGGWQVTMDGPNLKLKVGSYDLWAVAVNGTGGSTKSALGALMVVMC